MMDRNGKFWIDANRSFGNKELTEECLQGIDIHGVGRSSDEWWTYRVNIYEVWNVWSYRISKFKFCCCSVRCELSVHLPSTHSERSEEGRLLCEGRCFYFRNSPVLKFIIPLVLHMVLNSSIVSWLKKIIHFAPSLCPDLPAELHLRECDCIMRLHHVEML